MGGENDIVVDVVDNNEHQPSPSSIVTNSNTTTVAEPVSNGNMAVLSRPPSLSKISLSLKRTPSDPETELNATKKQLSAPTASEDKDNVVVNGVVEEPKKRTSKRARRPPERVTEEIIANETNINNNNAQKRRKSPAKKKKLDNQELPLESRLKVEALMVQIRTRRVARVRAKLHRLHLRKLHKYAVSKKNGERGADGEKTASSSEHVFIARESMMAQHEFLGGEDFLKVEELPWVKEERTRNTEIRDALLGSVLRRVHRTIRERRNNPPLPTADTTAKTSSLKKRSRKRPAQTQTIDESVVTDPKEIWKSLVKKDVVRAAKSMAALYSAHFSCVRRVAASVSREATRSFHRINRRATAIAGPITHTIAARKQAREIQAYWKKHEKEEREARKKAEKAALEAKRVEEEARESRRQARKLHFLLTQTELYGHFIAGGSAGANRPAPPPPHLSHSITEQPTATADLLKADWADIDDNTLASAAAAQAHAAFQRTQAHLAAFDKNNNAIVNNNHAPLLTSDSLIPPPSILRCQLKEYQERGLTWMANLYEQGINGILADEMGLGKTVQAISLLAYLAETHGKWGPFLVVTPVSTLHNWQQELARFVPDFKVMPYWGSLGDRKTLRKFWDPRRLGSRDSPFHVLITSYQLVVTDEACFHKVPWQYMVLDEAQAIKSSSTNRWRTLLKFRCRNRLLLTGTPLQNSMQELWALLHFIMPGLFDSHDEFSRWFARDIESATTTDKSTSSSASPGAASSLDKHQLQKLHAILKPFMLRRIKKDVEKELGIKTEILVRCTWSPKQRVIHEALKQRLPRVQLLKALSSSSTASASGDTTSVLMNLVMQFRKACNHPYLFDRPGVQSPYVMGSLAGAMCPGSSIPGPLVNSSIFGNHQAIYTLCFPGFSPQPLIPIQSLKQPRGDYDDDAIMSGLVLPKKEIPNLSSTLTTQPVHDAILHDDRLVHFYQRPAMAYAQQPAFNATQANDIRVPDPMDLILASGKMRTLDALLYKLKAGNHRCLIYNQMTRMLNLLEEYCQLRRWNYCRLDGSTRLSDRRDVVKAWQSDDTLFIFLLSTRSGGLGINLTAADTVIFYDSDWNPTVDAQAMDRSHRLGQTKPVTVYRLILKGSIEERVLRKAAHKQAIHSVVIDKQQLPENNNETAEEKDDNDDNNEFADRNVRDGGDEMVDSRELAEMLLAEEDDEDGGDGSGLIEGHK